MAKEAERYFACPVCCEPVTWSGILEECSSGGQGMCYCTYQSLEWSDEYKDFEPVFDRTMTEYVEITKTFFDVLISMKETDRIQQAYIPESQLIKKLVYCDRCKEEIARGN